MPYGVINADKQVDSLNNVFAPASAVMRNRIINGAMVIDQRNNGASVATSSGSQIYTVDRWIAQYSQTSKFTIQQNAGSVTLPVGFINYLGVTSSSAYSVGASDYFTINQRIEGFNIADLAWGTANAKTVTLSFQVYSSLTGTFGGVLQNGSANRSYPFIYTVSSANTWTPISITIAGDTTGTWSTNNGIGILVAFGLGVGSTYSGTAGSWSGNNYASATGAVSVVGTSSATLYITGVQLEVGLNATNFEYRQYGTELQLCQRYHYGGNASSASSITGAGINARFLAPISYTSGQALRLQMAQKVSMRAAPTITYSDGSGNLNKSYFNGSNQSVSTYEGTSEISAFVATSTVSTSQIDFNVYYVMDAEL